MREKGLWVFFSLLALFAVDFFIPFFVLKDRASFFGSYLYWSLLTLVVIGGGIIYTRRWTEDEEGDLLP